MIFWCSSYFLCLGGAYVRTAAFKEVGPTDETNQQDFQFVFSGMTD
jgi:hypothetical protein